MVRAGANFSGSADMSQAVYNLGSLNIDRVLRVQHIARPGETVAARSVALFAGGKGANQSMALRRAGARVIHVGRIGDDGRWLIDKLADDGIDTQFIAVSSGMTGQAIIQVDDAGENCIVLSGGANLELTRQDVERALQQAPAGSWLLMQNETTAVADAIELAHARGMRVALNPAPFDQQAREYSLDLVHLICVNETEGAELTGQSSAARIMRGLRRRLGHGEVLLTLGAAGAWYAGPSGQWRSRRAADPRSGRHHGRGRHVFGLFFGRQGGGRRTEGVPGASLPCGNALLYTCGGDGLDSLCARS